jgi:glyoxylase-like metal-dependent hydrolase (beta-lactamase superfamily II)
MRSHFLRTALPAVAAPLFALGAQANFDTVTVRSQRVADGIYMLTGSGGNIGLATGPEATFIIDDQYAPLTQKILAAVKTVTSQPVRFVLNTHWHFDHTGGNENFAQTGVVIFAHDNVRTRLSRGQLIEQLKRTLPAAPHAALPTVTFSDTLTLHFNDETVEVFHVANAHTDGDAMMYFRKANVVHTGDVFVRYGYPFIDTSSGGTFLGTISAIDQLLALTNASTKYIPGHGALAERKDVEQYRSMLRTARDRIFAQVKAGKSVEQVKNSKPLADLDAAWGKGMIASDGFVELIYGELAKK